MTTYCNEQRPSKKYSIETKGLEKAINSKCINIGECQPLFQSNNRQINKTFNINKI